MSHNHYIVSMSSSSTNVSSSVRITGRVKWFNNKAGYGFITSTSGAQSGNDIFVHHSALVVSNQQYRYLVQGEYVEFQLNSVEDGTHKFQASSVSGINGGMLMCETRKSFRETRAKPDQEAAAAPVEEETAEPTKKSRRASPRGSGPREDMAAPAVESAPAARRSKATKGASAN